MKMRLVGCVGGWCESREKCAHYLEGNATRDIRLCGDEEDPMVIKEVQSENDIKESKND